MKDRKVLGQTTPLTIYKYFLLMLALFSFIGIPILSIGYSGGEQRPLILLAYTMHVAIWGLLLLAIISSCLYWKWFKKFWYINVMIAVIASTIIISVLMIEKSAPEYIFVETTKTIGGKEWIIRKEYYEDTKNIRSVNFWLNGKKDSVWTTYSEKGIVIKQEHYSNDILLKK